MDSREIAQVVRGVFVEFGFSGRGNRLGWSGRELRWEVLIGRYRGTVELTLGAHPLESPRPKNPDMAHVSGGYEAFRQLYELDVRGALSDFGEMEPQERVGRLRAMVELLVGEMRSHDTRAAVPLLHLTGLSTRWSAWGEYRNYASDIAGEGFSFNNGINNRRDGVSFALKTPGAEREDYRFSAYPPSLDPFYIRGARNCAVLHGASGEVRGYLVDPDQYSPKDIFRRTLFIFWANGVCPVIVDEVVADSVRVSTAGSRRVQGPWSAPYAIPRSVADLVPRAERFTWNGPDTEVACDESSGGSGPVAESWVWPSDDDWYVPSGLGTRVLMVGCCNTGMVPWHVGYGIVAAGLSPGMLTGVLLDWGERFGVLPVAFGERQITLLCRGLPATAHAREVLRAELKAFGEGSDQVLSGEVDTWLDAKVPAEGLSVWRFRWSESGNDHE